MAEQASSDLQEGGSLPPVGLCLVKGPDRVRFGGASTYHLPNSRPSRSPLYNSLLAIFDYSLAISISDLNFFVFFNVL